MVALTVLTLLALSFTSLSMGQLEAHTRSSPQSFHFTSTFDDIENIDPAVSTQPINVYNLIYWQAMTLATPGTPQISGVVPNSQSNCAVFSNTTTVMQGQAEMTVNYDGSTINAFTLSSFYYGCAVDTALSPDSEPVVCTITINGFNQAGSNMASQSFTNQPGGLLQQMTFAKVGGAFQNMYTVTFNYVGTSAFGTVGDIVGIIDTVDYTVFQ